MEKDTQKTLGEILKALKSLDTRVARIESGGHQPKAASGKSPAGAAAKQVSIREFLLKHSPTNDVQTTLAVGHFLESHAGMASFNKTDLEKGYRDAKESPPSNVNANVNECIRQGHMMEAGEKKANMKAWVITRTGEQFIQSGFKKATRGK